MQLNIMLSLNHTDSDVIKRLLVAGRRDRVRDDGEHNKDAADRDREGIDSKLTVTDFVILFARIEGENYCCLGRLLYASYNLKRQPVEFEWELQDYEMLRKSETFQRMIDMKSK